MKRVVTILIAVLFAVPAMARNPLQAYFDTANKAYFGGSLPKAEVGWGATPPGVMALTYVKDGRFVIVLDPKTNAAPRVADLTILHEACHLKNWGQPDGLDNHGPKFQACMHDLVTLGAMEDLW